MVNRWFSQRDPAYNRQPIGQSSCLISAWGCTLVSICNVILDLLGKEINPGEASKLWDFTKNGEIIWSGIRFEGLKFLRRAYTAPTHEVASGAIAGSHRAILRLRQNPLHWVYLYRWTSRLIPWFLCVDPYTFNPKTQSAFIVRKWKSSIDGYSLFERTTV